MNVLPKNIANLRVDYSLKNFDEKDVQKNPFQQFSLWLNEAIEAEVNEPNAMTLGTVKPDGRPSARIVLLKGLDENGFIFYTNYQSNKGNEIAQNSNVAIVFCWLELQRQVRIEGIAKKISSQQSDEYFNSRPHKSKIGAHASPQSDVIINREVLEKQFAEFEKLFSEQPIIRPEHWGGYLVEPTSIEFWQGRQSRLHDRFLYSKQSNNSWEINRLAP